MSTLTATESKECKSVVTEAPQETLALARRFASLLKPGSVVGLLGEMGAGKTHFVKGVVEGLGGDPAQVDSPTFAIINAYQARLPVYHVDCYRLESEEEAWIAGVETCFDGRAVSLIEWPEHIDRLLPGNAIYIRLAHVAEEKRRFTIETGLF